jgi:pectinesterase
MADDYHRDNGEGADFYSAGRSRGCGGSGLWRDGKLVVSRNFRESRVLANGPIRLVFELHYPLWNAAGIRSETKRITLDAGQNFNRFESRYDADDAGAYAAGVKKTALANVRIERDRGWIRTWEPVKEKENLGQFGCAVIVDPSSVIDVTEGEGNQLMVARTPAVYHAGSAWDRSGDFPRGREDFDNLIEQWTQRIRSPLRVEVTPQ